MAETVEALTGTVERVVYHDPKSRYTVMRLLVPGHDTLVTAVGRLSAIDAGLEVIDVDLPAVVTTDLRLNEPRYVKLPDIMKAKRKPLETLAIASLDVAVTPQVRGIRYEPPPQRQAGILVADVDALVAALREKGFFN